MSHRLCRALCAALLLAIPAFTHAADEIKKPAAPKEFAFVLSNGYGIKDHFSNDPDKFENLLINMKKSGFNCIHCVYRDWRVKLCAKHGVKMMVDVLAWEEGVEMDIRRPAQRETLKKIVEGLRDNDAIWGYNLWNERLAFFGRP